MRQKVAALIVRLRIPLMILMLILAVLCGTTIRSVKVNYDLISYLDDDTAAMRGLAIMNSEFPACPVCPSPSKTAPRRMRSKQPPGSPHWTA